MKSTYDYQLERVDTLDDRGLTKDTVLLGGVELDGSGVEAEWRIGRLNRVLGFTAAKTGIAAADLRERTGLVSLYDHKGNLESEWYGASRFAKYVHALHEAWEDEAECQHVAVIYDYHDLGRRQIVDLS